MNRDSRPAFEILFGIAVSARTPDDSIEGLALNDEKFPDLDSEKVRPGEDIFPGLEVNL